MPETKPRQSKDIALSRNRQEVQRLVVMPHT
jgi:hypothetical protein